MAHDRSLWPTEPDDTNSRPNWRDIIEDLTAADLNAIEEWIRDIQDRIGSDTYGGGVAGSDFFAYQHPSGGLRLRVNPGNLYTGASDPLWVAQQDTSTLTGPVTNPRIDVAALDNATGAVSWVAGSESATPAIPAIPTTKTPLWAVYLRVGATAIDRPGYDTGTNSYLYRDMRPGMGTRLPALSGSLSLTGIIGPISVTANQDNYAPTGFAAPAAAGEVKLLFNVSAANNLTLKDASGSSSAANRFAFPSGDIVLLPLQGVWLAYETDGTNLRWRAAYPPADAATTIASLRTLGTGASQAAAGNHTHAGTGFYQTVVVDATTETQRGKLKLIGGTNVSLSAVDNSGSDQTEVTIDASAGAGGYSEVDDEGSALTARTKLNFIGAGVTAVDNSGAGRTDVTIPGGAMTLIADTTLGASASDITFSSIPGTYKGLLLLFHGRSDGSAKITTMQMRFNGDTGSNYDSVVGELSGAAIGHTKIMAAAQAYFGAGVDNAAPSGSAASYEMVIPEYAGTTFHKGYKSRGFARWDTSSEAEDIVSGQWRSTAAITSIKIYPDAGSFIAGTRMSLWGLQ